MEEAVRVHIQVCAEALLIKEVSLGVVHGCDV